MLAERIEKGTTCPPWAESISTAFNQGARCDGGRVWIRDFHRLTWFAALF
jgi:hypothetical protein